MRWNYWLGLAIAAGLSTSAAAETLPGAARLYAGVEAGLGERHIDVADDEQLIAGRRRDRGVAYGVFAGAEVPLSAPLFLAVEVRAGRAEASPKAILFRGIQLPGPVLIGVTDAVRVDPRWSYGATARLGVSPLPRIGLYGLAGYGAERVRISRADVLGTAGAPTSRLVERRTRDGVIYGAGVRYRLGRYGARVEYRRMNTDGSYDPEQLMGGLFVSF